MIDWAVRDRVGWLTFDRANVLNAMSAPMMERAAEIVEGAEVDDGVRAIVLTGRGRAFSSGADLDGAERPEAATDPSKLDAASRLVRAIRATPVPVIAAVNGVAAGVGASIVLACDVIHMARSASLYFAFAKVGLMPDGAATLSLPMAVGASRAFELLAGGGSLDPATARDLGIANAVHEDADLRAAVEQVAAALTDGPPLAIARIKAAINHTRWSTVEDHLTLEREGQLALMVSEDFREAISAFRARRPPRFSGR